ncbi:hypothetical protein Q9L58_001222 [Maublancomyces gigas]|uniref:Copper acquisition factor BIM1-like domain-containing protein n=1 Tax=Discina gigas TaxID=1032678 RepID=A0ABR3GV30_9PEZI
MQLQSVFLATLSATVVSAHFRVKYPYWRGDSIATQNSYPCGGVDQTISANNRTLWPIDGGALVFSPGHDFAQTYVNLGLGNEVTRFNITLAAPFNQTGNGTFCFPKFTLPKDSGAQEGTNASIQVIQLSHNGGALYNCADITFSANVSSVTSDVCFNSTGVGAAPFTYNGDTSKTTCDSASNTTESGAATTSHSAASNLGISIVSVGAVGLAVAAMMI